VVLQSTKDGRRSFSSRRLHNWPIHAYFLVLVALFVLAATAAGLYVRHQSERDARASALAEARYASNAASRQLGAYIVLLKQTVAQLAANPRIAQTISHPAGCTLSFSGIGGPDRGHLDILAPDGTVACSSRPHAPGARLSGYRGETWLHGALTHQSFLAPVVDRATGAQVALTAIPIPGEKGIVVAFADLGAGGRDLAKQFGGGRPVEFLVTSRDGNTVIARSLDPDRWVGKSLQSSSFAAAGDQVDRVDLDGTSRLYAMSAVPGVGWNLYVGEDKRAALASVARLANRELVIILLGLGAFLLAASLTYFSLVRPISRLRATLRKSQDDAQLTEVPTVGPAEIKGLAEDINGLINSVERELGERERAEQLAHASERNYRQLFEGNPHPMWVFATGSLRFLAVNDAAILQYGYTREEFLTMTIEDIRPPEDVPLLLEVYDAEGEPRELNPPTIWRHRRKDGSTIDVQISSHAHEFEGASARVVLALDVTDLRASEARYRDLFENATDLIATTDLDGHITNANQAFVNATGYSLEELLGKPVVELVPPEFHRQLQDARSDKLEAGQSATVYEHELIAKGGDRIQVEVSSRVTDLHGRPNGVEAICRDVSERKRLEDQLRQSQRLEAVGQLAGGIAHDFNNLLTVISGYTEVLLGSDEQTGQRELAQIAGASTRAATLTRQLLAFSRRQVLQPRVIDLNEVIENLTPMLTRLIGEHLELEAVLGRDLHHVTADPGQIEQVLMNLAVNARDAMPDGGKLTIETGNAMLDERYAAAHQDANVGPHAMLAVSDTGVGMDAATLEKVFEPFFTTKPAGIGTGLGLSTVHGIVNQSGGNIWVYSEPGNGTTFKLYFPADNAELTGESDDGAPTAVPSGTETILVVEDDPALLGLVAEMLEVNGYSVLAAATPGDALRIAEQHLELDLVLTDLVMPQASGRELARQLTDLVPTVRVLFMSGYADEAVTRSGALEAGAAYLEKPFSAHELARKIRSTLDSDARRLHPVRSLDASPR
jgi:PAS domain S-box-containing protein